MLYSSYQGPLDFTITLQIPFLVSGVVVLKKDPTFFDIPAVEKWDLCALPLNMNIIK